MDTVNKPARRVDALGKVLGESRYGADLSFEGMLYGKVLRAPYTHARILSIDTARALALPGVEAVLTAADIPGFHTFGTVIPNQQVLAKEVVRYQGDGVAMAAAATPALAQQALDLIRVQYQELAGVFDPARAMEEGAPLLHADCPGNIAAHHVLEKGEVEKGFACSDIILEREYETQLVEHAYIEPEAAVAVPQTGNRGVTVYGSIQNPFSCRKALSRILGLKLNEIRVIQSFMGGSFGGKDEVMSALCARAALLALKTGKPVKMVNTREESIREGYKRHPYKLKYKVGATREGKLMAMEIKIIADAGAYASQTPFVTWRSVVQATGPYEVPHVRTNIYGVYTNNCYTGAFRGFGSPQIIFAQESLLDELAEELGIEPLELRRLNGFRQGSVTATGQKLDNHQVSLLEVVDKAVEKSAYLTKRRQYAAQRGRFRKGIGLACSFRGCSLGAEGVDATGAMVSVQYDGSVYVYSGLAENGQGLQTIFSQIAAEELGISLERVRFMETDTALIPDGGPTVASRSTLMGGNAVRLAAAKVRETLLGAALEKLRAGAEELAWGGDRIWLKEDPSRSISFEEAVNAACAKGELLAQLGWYKAPKVTWDDRHGQGDAYFTYVYGCQVAEVEVDMETGYTRVLKITAAHDVGRAINPETVRGQIYGGVAQGLGYALLEEVQQHEGEIKSLNFDEYLIPGICDMPEIEAIIVENPDSYGPYGAKTIGEPTLEVTAPAIASAVAQATGRRVRQLPLDLERVLLGRSLQKDRYKRREGGC
ncbi:MAG: xanthine dehydrogenase family protein molybdopterin-binding subunit [Eubacteriales bacterium]|nr:xanthine dehydrogenase family protein molybdopterin-binding subunit [Eubacteriales bacterium]